MDHGSTLRAQCLRYLEAGMGAQQVAKLLGRSRQWVYNTKRSGSAGIRDRRRRTNEHLFAEAVRLHEEIGCAPTQAAALLRHNGQIPPSVAAITAEFWRRQLHTSQSRAIAPMTSKRPPLAGHGEEFTIDVWGPWLVPGMGLVLVLTGMDSFSRTVGGVVWHHLHAEAYTRSLAYLVDRLYGDRWPTRLMISYRLAFVLPPVQGQTAPLVRLALAHHTVPIFLPVAQPWDNARLKRFHVIQKRDFWQKLPPLPALPDLRQQYLEWLDYYNMERRHAGTHHQPVELANGRIRRFAERPELPYIPPIGPHTGLVEYWRRVQPGGWIDLHGEMIRVQSCLVGQQVIVRLAIAPGQVGTGEIVWQSDSHSEPIWVARVGHAFDSAAPSVDGASLVGASPIGASPVGASPVGASPVETGARGSATKSAYADLRREKPLLWVTQHNPEILDDFAAYSQGCAQN